MWPNSRPSLKWPSPGDADFSCYDGMVSCVHCVSTGSDLMVS